MPVRPFSDYSDLCLEIRRLETFIDWPIPWLKPEELASDGFYYLRHLDHCACIFCRGIVGNWEKGDEPRSEHKRHFPQCPFINGRGLKNVRIDACMVIAKLKDSPAMRVPPLSKMKMPQPFSNPPHTGPRRYEFSTKESRLKSFHDDYVWPACLQDKIDSMVNAGLFYCGLSDHVRCYHCGNGLCNWDKEDDPMEAHMKFFPECKFVNFNMEWSDSPFTEEQVKSEAVVAAPAVGVTPKENEENGEKVAAIIDDVPITESDINILMETDICKAVLNMGFPITSVKGALLSTLSKKKITFRSLEEGIESTLVYLEKELRKEQELKEINTCLTTHSSEEGVSEGEDISPIMQHPVPDKKDEVSVTLEQTSIFESVLANNEEDEASSTLEQTSMFKSVLANKEKDEPSSTLEQTSVFTSVQPNKSEIPEPRGEEEQKSVQELINELHKYYCKVCWDDMSNVLFLPCCHLLTCFKCALLLKTCPLCRTHIKHSIKVMIG